MNNLIAKFADAITPGLVAFPVAIMLTTAAHAAPVNVRLPDLNVATHTGQVALQARAGGAAQSFCGDEKNLGIQAACKAGVRQEAQEKLATAAPATVRVIAVR
ncbi:UrcA family protein [Phenylobacterium sp.]|uniref:UrcA family protein n=1 Tax=Phenylobacterium sp. TaxID=1871053 RepID=UPI0026380155|nr:UrcA family protein [Phenylobacterium sp.]